MSGLVEVSKCDICGNEGPVQRKYYHYKIKCECCSSGGKPQHFEIVRHCSNCTPKPPKYIKPQLIRKPID